MRRAFSVFLFLLLLGVSAQAGVYPGQGRFTGRWCVGGRGGGCFATKARAERRFREMNHRRFGGGEDRDGGGAQRGTVGSAWAFAPGFDPDRIAVAFAEPVGSTVLFPGLTRSATPPSADAAPARVAGASPASPGAPAATSVPPSYTLEDAPPKAEVPAPLCDDLESFLGPYREAVTDMRDTVKRMRRSGFTAVTATEEHSKIGKDIETLDGSAEDLEGRTVQPSELQLKEEVTQKLRDLSRVLRDFYDDFDAAVEAGDADDLNGVVFGFEPTAAKTAPGLLRWSDGIAKKICKRPSKDSKGTHKTSD